MRGKGLKQQEVGFSSFFDLAVRIVDERKLPSPIEKLFKKERCPYFNGYFYVSQNRQLYGLIPRMNSTILVGKGMKW
jgi:hypothetical protein